MLQQHRPKTVPGGDAFAPNNARGRLAFFAFSVHVHITDSDTRHRDKTTRPARGRRAWGAAPCPCEPCRRATTPPRTANRIYGSWAPSITHRRLMSGALLIRTGGLDSASFPSSGLWQCQCQWKQRWPGCHDRGPGGARHVERGASRACGTLFATMGRVSAQPSTPEQAQIEHALGAFGPVGAAAS